MAGRPKINSRNVRFRIENELKGLLKDPRLLRDIGEFVSERIRQQARLSKSMATGKKLPALSKSYRDYKAGVAHFRKYRGRIVRLSGKDPNFPDTSRFFKPRARGSNLTLTGQLLDAISYIPERGSRNGAALSFFIGGKRRPQPGVKKRFTNDQVYTWLIGGDSGYEVMGLDEKGSKQVRKIVLEELRRRLKSLNSER